MSIPLEDGTSAGMLDYLQHYFEFIPEEEVENASPTILEAHEVERDRNYYILLTTSSGFYRYNIYDVVQCVGFYGQVLVIKFLNKGTCFSSITGEKLSEFQIVSAVQRAFAAAQIPIEHFTVEPEFGDSPGYVGILESGVWQLHEKFLTRQIDQQLSLMNCEYENRLQTGRLKPLRICEIAPGTWNAFRQKRIRRIGGSLEQYKHPCLVNDLNFVANLRQLRPLPTLMVG